MTDLAALESRAQAALEKLKKTQSDQAQSGESEARAEVEKLKSELVTVTEKLEKEERVHLALQDEFLDVCQDFGAMELDNMKSAAAGTSDDAIAELKRQHAKDIAEVDEILSKLAPIVEV